MFQITKISGIPAEAEFGGEFRTVFEGDAKHNVMIAESKLPRHTILPVLDTGENSTYILIAQEGSGFITSGDGGQREFFAGDSVTIQPDSVVEIRSGDAGLKFLTVATPAITLQ